MKYASFILIPPKYLYTKKVIRIIGHKNKGHKNIWPLRRSTTTNAVESPVIMILQSRRNVGSFKMTIDASPVRLKSLITVNPESYFEVSKVM